LRTKLKLTPEEYRTALMNVDDVFRTSYDMNSFFSALCKYTGLEVSKLIPDESKHMVITFKHHHAAMKDEIKAYDYTSIVAYVRWNIGGAERYIEVHDAIVAMDLRISETRAGFNSLIDEVVNNIVARVAKVMRSLQKSGVR